MPCEIEPYARPRQNGSRTEQHGYKFRCLAVSLISISAARSAGMTHGVAMTTGLASGDGKRVLRARLAAYTVSVHPVHRTTATLFMDCPAAETANVLRQVQARRTGRSGNADSERRTADQDRQQRDALRCHRWPERHEAHAEGNEEQSDMTTPFRSLPPAGRRSDLPER
jgi:hypothetical protein